MRWSRIAAAQDVLESERGAVIKDWGGRLPIALLYPNSYYVGMSSLAVHSLYRLLNQLPGIVCERVFCGHRRPDDHSEPISMETQRRLTDFGVVGISLSFELDYLHLVAALRNANIPLRSSDRDEAYPLLLAGGPAVSANPEPLAELCDAFVIGEAEGLLPRLLDVLHQGISGERRLLLTELSLLPGVYVPALGPATATEVERQWVPDLDRHPTHSAIFARQTEFGDRFLTEIGRGCRHACQFCLASCLYRPLRERSAAEILRQARWARPYSTEIGLVSTAVSDYSQLPALLGGLRELDMRVSVSSLRVDPLPRLLLQALADGGTRTLTVAPEAGSERLRASIRKGISRDEIWAAADAAAQFDFAELKLYFMIGLPGETEEDVDAIVELVRQVRSRFSRGITVSLSPFVPKAHTPLERAAMAPGSTLSARLQRVSSTLRPEGVRVSGESVDWAEVQAVLARGDRRLGTVLTALRRPSLSGWRRALRAADLVPQEYTRERPAAEPLPWAFISMRGSNVPAAQTPAEPQPSGSLSPNDAH